MKATRLAIVRILFCLLAIVLYTGCDNREKTAPVTIDPDAKLVCLFFDDGWQNQYDMALPILLKYNFKATFGVITGEIGIGEGLWKHMGEKELKELTGYGMDIASHTRTHPDLTANLDDKQLRDEIIESKRDLEKLGFKVRTFVSPHHKWNDAVIEYIENAGYVCGRAGLEKPFDLTTTNLKARFHVPGYPIVGQDFEQFKAIVDKASGDSAICLVYHFISDSGPLETSTPVANFHEQISYLKEGGFTVLLLPDLFR